MRTMTLIMIFVFLFVVTDGFAESDTVVRGTEWLTMSQDQRTEFILGFVNAANSIAPTIFCGGRCYTPKEDTVDDQTLKRMEEECRKEGGIDYVLDPVIMKKGEVILRGQKCSKYKSQQQRNYEYRTSARFSFSRMSVLQLLAGLNDFYKDFKNTRISVIDAIYVVKKQIEGTPKEDIETILVFLRQTIQQGKEDSRMLEIKDEKGQVTRIIEFP